MIAGLSGILKEIALTEIYVDVNGVIYKVFIPMSTYDRLPKAGENVEIFTYLKVLEDDLQLYGFATKEEKQLFETLLSVSGIGPKLGLNVLSSMTVGTFCAAIASSDIKMLGKINGIGKKTAERMVLELRNKIKAVSPEAMFPSGKVPDKIAKFAEDAILALVQLGFKYDTAAKTIHELVKHLPHEECGSENLIRVALQELNK